MDEMRDVQSFRAEVPESSRRALLPARNRLIDEARGGRSLLSRLPRPRKAATRVATAGTLSVALAGGLVAIQTVDFGGDGNAPGATAQAAAVLHKAATAAGSEPASSPGRFSYVELKRTSHAEHRAQGEDDPYTVHTHEKKWFSVDGSEAGLARRKITVSGVDVPFEGGKPAKYSPQWRERRIEEQPALSTYAYWDSMPHDSDALLHKLREECAKYDADGPQCDYLTWKYAAGAASGQVMPPEVRATLFQAMTKIPGVKVVEDATLPATGESGIGITRTVAAGQWRVDLVFDPETYEVLGSRTVVVGDGGPERAGTVNMSTAILDKGLVEEVGQRP